MFRIPNDRSWPPQVDLGTARETLAYIHDDMRRFPRFRKIADALEVAMREMEAAEADQPSPLVRGGKVDDPTLARFFPFRR